MSSPEAIEEWFQRFKEIFETYRVGLTEIWNEDECGMRIECLRERVKVVVVRTTRKKRHEVMDPNNCESCTLVGCANAAGSTIPPYMVFKVFPSTGWALMPGTDNYRFAQSDTGFSNTEIAMDWIRWFNKSSWEQSAQARGCGQSLVDWFGCDEWLRVGPYKFKEPPHLNEKRIEDKIFRLLLLGGFTGHTSLSFIEYCIVFDIIIVFSRHTRLTSSSRWMWGFFNPLRSGSRSSLGGHYRKAT